MHAAILRHSAIPQQLVRQLVVAIEKYPFGVPRVVENGDSVRFQMAMPRNLHVSDLVTSQQRQNMGFDVATGRDILVTHLGGDHDQLIQRTRSRFRLDNPPDEDAGRLHPHPVGEQRAIGHGQSTSLSERLVSFSEHSVPKAPIPCVLSSLAN